MADFGQKVLTNITWNIERTPDDLKVSGLITAEDDNGCDVPADLTGCEIDIYFYDPDDGTVILQLSSTGISPAITIYPGVNQDPNFKIFMLNATFITYFSEDTTVPYRFVFTNSDSEPETYFTGPAVIGNSTLQGC